jgi:hypothetical protein
VLTGIPLSFVPSFSSFFNKIKKTLRGEGYETSGFKAPLDMPVFRNDVIDLHRVGKGCDQRISMLQTTLLMVFLKGRLGHFNQSVIFDFL